MMQKHYDVIVVGRSIGALSAAALLARRDFNVLSIGHHALPATYKAAGHELWRRAFTFLAATSPAWRRIVIELAQSQTWKRRLVPASPMLQAVAPGWRFEVPADPKRFAREVARELAGLGRVVEQLYDDLARVNAAADDAFASDATWPPGTFWERRETGRLAATLPYVHAEPDADLLGEFPRGHFYRRFVHASALFATHLSTLPPPFAIARHHGAWTRGLASLPGGEAELEGFLVERIAAHGGTCWLNRRAKSVLLRRGVAAGVVLDGDDQAMGCDFILTDLDGESLAALAGGQGIHKRALREWPRITSTVGRFVVSLVVRREGLPEELGPEALFFSGASWPNRDRPPALHVQRIDGPGETSLLVAELLLPDHGALPLTDARAFVLRAVLEELPFLDRHLVVVDSPHDGLPVWCFAPHRRDLDRASFGLPAQEPMLRQLEVDPPGYLGLAGEPVRGPIEKTLLLGRSVLPGLGQEGELLAAWAAAKLVTKSDRRKAMMRRDMWTRMEFG
ncbi:MAG TPA: phytoene dehydrogenase [Polyangiaceae bacterium]|jgi:phytoene dehydrogenase-like protein|nr:phytoene dehydrogenase [Polyangiaceae bacterium]